MEKILIAFDASANDAFAIWVGCPHRRLKDSASLASSLERCDTFKLDALINWKPRGLAGYQIMHSKSSARCDLYRDRDRVIFTTRARLVGDIYKWPDGSCCRSWGIKTATLSICMVARQYNKPNQRAPMSHNVAQSWARLEIYVVESSTTNVNKIPLIIKMSEEAR